MQRSELAHFNKQMLIHELIRGSLVRQAASLFAGGCEAQLFDACQGFVA